MRIHHLALRTRRLEEVVRFYRRALGLRQLRVSRDGRRPRSVWLEAGRAIVMIERAGASEPCVPRGSLELVAFAATRDEHARLVGRLERLGVLPDGPPTGFTTYFRDPDGRRVGISHFPTSFRPVPRDARRKKLRAKRKAV